MPNSEDVFDKTMPPDHAECPDCGCTDAVLLDHRQRFGERVTADVRERVVALTARYRCNNCGKTWRASRPWTPRDEPAPENHQSVDQPPQQQAQQYDGRGVPFLVLRCPACRSPDTRITSTRRPVRYHRCGACGQTFKSVEKTDQP